MRNDCKHVDSCKLRVIGADFAKSAGIEIRETPCCVGCLYFEPRNDEVNKDE